MLDLISHLFESVQVQIGAGIANLALLIDVYIILYFTSGESFLLIKLLNYITTWLLLFMITAFFILLLISKYRLWKLYAIPGLVLSILMVR